MAFRCRRWTLANILPIAFMTTLISVIWILYLWLHIAPLMAGEVLCSGSSELNSPKSIVAGSSPPREHECVVASVRRGSVQAVIQQLLTAMLVICFARAILTDPGSVPNDSDWTVEWQGDPEEAAAIERGKPKRKQFEMKHTGARRQCKWCNRYKPDRAHHCRVCRSCILRMDHHCPWIANCVGFRNHKYFYLLVLYSLLDVAFVFFTAMESLNRSLVQETPLGHRFLLVFCLTLSVMMGLLLTMFFLFHSWLMFQTTTTIEFCEKNYRHGGDSKQSGSAKSIYDRGIWENICAILGSNPVFWLLPCCPPDGDGLSFAVSAGMDRDDECEESAPLLSKQRAVSSYQGEEVISCPAKDHVGFSDDGPNTPRVNPPFPSAPNDEGTAPEVTKSEASIS